MQMTVVENNNHDIYHADPIRSHRLIEDVTETHYVKVSRI